jgi:hypothetical protein
LLPGLQQRLQTAASAETTEASVALTAPAVAATVAVASVATIANISFALSTTTSLKCLQIIYEKFQKWGDANDIANDNKCTAYNIAI